MNGKPRASGSRSVRWWRLLCLTLFASSPGCSCFDPAGRAALEPGASTTPPARDFSPAADKLVVDGSLVREALRALELAETGAGAEALALADGLESRFPRDRGAPAVRAVLSAWLRKRDGETPVAGAGRATAPAVRSPKGAYIEYRTALEHADAGRTAEARAALESAHALDPTNEEIRAALGSALKEEGLRLYGSGDVEDALELWQRASDMAPADREVQTYIRRAEKVSGEAR